MSTQDWFASCPKGLEELLAAELIALGAESVRQTVAGVYATGPLALAYKICLWSRLANRLLLPLARFDVTSADSLYEQVRNIPWHHHLSPRETLAVDFVGSSDAIRHTRFGAQRVKDAIADVLKERYADRPDVDLRDPDIRINAHLSKGKLIISLDMSGHSLHRRGYRASMVAAPLKENLAAALLIRAGWPDIAAQGGALLDPMCGSGTLLIEGAMMAADIAPGLNRRKFGFHSWAQHENDIWEPLLLDARARRDLGLAKGLPEIRGYDAEPRAVRAAQQNIKAAWLEQHVHVSCKPLATFKKPTHTRIDTGLVITNPPYGERLGEVEELKELYRELGVILKRECANWRAAIFTGNPTLAGETRLRSSRKYQLYNGTIPSQLLLYELRSEDEQGIDKAPRPEQQQVLPEGAAMVANRIRKNSRKLKPWLKRTGVSSYRVYDSDIPEYAVAIDIYGDAIHVQEYAAPASIDDEVASKRLEEVQMALQELYPRSRELMFFKERRRQRGDNQYRRQNAEPSSTRKNAIFTASEGSARLEVNLQDYLDSGVFLDHRPVRAMIGKMARGKRFLNLFCYTAAATVQAALGGAESSLSIDMSNTYLDWARRNFDLNTLDKKRHQLLRADCLEWLASRDNQQEQQFDLIFLDPPTFSNSKKMAAVLDIQRDHPQLIGNAMAMLAPGGSLLFSNNFRRFKMDGAVSEKFEVENITDKTLDPDFARNQRIHNCWLIKHPV